MSASGCRDRGRKKRMDRMREWKVKGERETSETERGREERVSVRVRERER